MEKSKNLKKEKPLNTNSIEVFGIEKSSMVNGKGIRYTIFTQGCKHFCPGCHNKDSWESGKGVKVKFKDIYNDIYERRNFIDGVSFSGGEPLEQYQSILLLAKLIKKDFNLTIWLWTGHTFEFLNDYYSELLTYVDVIIDRKYDQNKPTENPYKGSSNQRMWVKKKGTNKHIEVKENEYRRKS